MFTKHIVLRVVPTKTVNFANWGFDFPKSQNFKKRWIRKTFSNPGLILLNFPCFRRSLPSVRSWILCVFKSLFTTILLRNEWKVPRFLTTQNSQIWEHWEQVNTFFYGKSISRKKNILTFDDGTLNKNSVQFGVKITCIDVLLKIFPRLMSLKLLQTC